MRIEASDQTWHRGDRARLIRLFSMGATTAYAPLGLATAAGTPRLADAMVLVAVGVSFHLYAFPLNDVIDLPIDRTNARRSDGPLVRDLVRPRTMLLVALLQVPVMAALLLAGGASAAAWLAWAVAVACLGAYDLWGKRMYVPGAPDLVQGVGFAALVVMGASWVGEPTAVSWLAAAYVVVYIVQINAVHGGLRDMANDAAHGARTTPLLLGCGVDAAGMPQISSRMLSFTLFTEVAMVGLVIWLALEVVDQTAALVTAVAAIGSKLWAAWLGVRAYRVMTDRPRMMSLGVWNLFWALLAVVVAPVGAAPLWLGGLTLVVFLAPPAYFARLTS